MRVLFFDIESTSLSANWGRVLCTSFAGLEGSTWTLRRDEKPFRGKTKVDDAKLVKAIRDEIEDSDIIVGWNSILFDVPLLNARLAVAGERPIRVGAKHGTMHIDLMWYAGGSSMRIGGRKLATVSKFFGVEHSKTELDGDTWQLAAAGDYEAMDDVATHCEQDILVLRDLWPHLAPGIMKHNFAMSEVWKFIDKIPSRRLG